MENSYLIECEECDNESSVLSYVEVEFCPICGRRTEAIGETKDVEDY